MPLHPSIVHPKSMRESSSSAASTESIAPPDTAIAVAIGAAVCALVTTCVVLYKKKSRSSQSPAALGKDYESYCPSPFNPARHHHHHRASSRDSQQNDALSIEHAGGDIVSSVNFPGDEDELSNSYRTCSRVYSERLSSEHSWVMTSSRSIRSIDDDSEEENKIGVSTRGSSRHHQLSALVKQRIGRSSSVLDDSFIESDGEGGNRGNRADPRTTASSDSSELFSTFMASERSSDVSWSLGSSWSGSEVSSLDSARATDVSLSEHSLCSSRSFRASSTCDQSTDNEDAAASVKESEARLPAPSAIAVATRGASATPPSRCDRILLFKSIKPRQLRSKPKRFVKATELQQQHQQQQMQEDEERRVWYC